MAVARDDLGRAARKRGSEGQVTTIRHFGIRFIFHVPLLLCMIMNNNEYKTKDSKNCSKD